MQIGKSKESNLDVSKPVGQQQRAATIDDYYIIKKTQGTGIKNIIAINNLIQASLRGSEEKIEPEIEKGKDITKKALKRSDSSKSNESFSSDESNKSDDLAEPEELDKSGIIGEISKLDQSVEEDDENEIEDGKNLKGREGIFNADRQDGVRLDPFLTTIGIESEFSSFNSKKIGKMDFPSHILLATEGKANATSPLLNIPWQLETDAQRVLEIVSPPLLAPMLLGAKKNKYYPDKAWTSIVRGKIENTAKSVVDGKKLDISQICTHLNKALGTKMKPVAEGINELNTYIKKEQFGTIKKGTNRDTNSQINFRTNIDTYADIVEDQVMADKKPIKNANVSKIIERDIHDLAKFFNKLLHDSLEDVDLKEEKDTIKKDLSPYLLVMAIKLSQLPNTVIDAYRAAWKSGVGKVINAQTQASIAATSNANVTFQSAGSHVKDVTTAWLKASAVQAVSGAREKIPGLEEENIFKDDVQEKVIAKLKTTNTTLLKFVASLANSAPEYYELSENIKEIIGLDGIYSEGAKQILNAYKLSSGDIEKANKFNKDITDQTQLGPSVAKNAGGGARSDTYIIIPHEYSGDIKGDNNMFLIELRQDETKKKMEAVFLAYTKEEIAYNDVIGGAINDEFVRKNRPSKSLKTDAEIRAWVIKMDVDHSKSNDLKHPEKVIKSLNEEKEFKKKTTVSEVTEKKLLSLTYDIELLDEKLNDILSKKDISGKKLKYLNEKKEEDERNKKFKETTKQIEEDNQIKRTELELKISKENHKKIKKQIKIKQTKINKLNILIDKNKEIKSEVEKYLKEYNNKESGSDALNKIKQLSGSDIAEVSSKKKTKKSTKNKLKEKSKKDLGDGRLPRLIYGSVPYDGDCLYNSLHQAYDAPTPDIHRESFQENGVQRVALINFLNTHYHTVHPTDIPDYVPPSTREGIAEMENRYEQTKLENIAASMGFMETLLTPHQWVQEGDNVARFVIQNFCDASGKIIHVIQDDGSVLTFTPGNQEPALAPDVDYSGPVIIRSGDHYMPGLYKIN